MNRAQGRNLLHATLLGTSLTCLAAVALAQVAPTIKTPNLQLNLQLTAPHSVKGFVVQPQSCGSGLTITLKEVWYVDSGAGAPSRPATAADGFQGLQLSRVLGSSAVNAQNGSFNIGWMELNAADRMPWKVAHPASGGGWTVHRVLLLSVMSSGSSGPSIFMGHPVPAPMILFVGRETSKDVRGIKLVCFPIGG